MAPKAESATYTHGHHPSVLRAHTWRTAKNSCSHLLPHLKPDHSILDIGCGPGTITVDLATYVPQGHIIGLEHASAVLDEARAHAKSRDVKNVDFIVGDGNALDFPDGTFDVVHCHQVLQHVRDPVGILREMRRVAKPGGIVAVRESDYGGFVYFPEVDGMKEWKPMYQKVARSNGGEPNAGRMAHSWVREAGFQRKDMDMGSSTWCYSSPEETKWWGGLWAERTVASSFATTAIGNGIATAEELEKIADAFREWGARENAWFSILHGEIICRKVE